jgi:hypothetical protein
VIFLVLDPTQPSGNFPVVAPAGIGRCSLASFVSLSCENSILSIVSPANAFRGGDLKKGCTNGCRRAPLCLLFRATRRHAYTFFQEFQLYSLNFQQPLPLVGYELVEFRDNMTNL